MVAIPDVFGEPNERSVAAGPFAVDTPYGHDVGFDLVQCDENQVTWSSQDRVLSMKPLSPPEVKDDDSIVFWVTDGEVVLRPFASSDTWWVMSEEIPQSSDDVKARAEQIVSGANE